MEKRKWLLYIHVFILIILWPLCLNADNEQDTVVQIKPGKVKGFYLPKLSGSVIAYLGIPYGEAPTGTQRFKKPEPRKPWEGIYEATNHGKSCYQKRDEAYAGFPGTNMWQVNNEMSEDCLFLNVWVPSSRPKSAHVMVFIYGGAFLAGTSSLELYDPSILAFSEDIIVVSMNYRVGALGFLALPGNRDIPGNAGLFDQQLALQWVHENIAAFGGNPDSITLFGHSSGAACVGFHLLSPGSQNYVKRAIFQSGSVSAPWAINTHKRANRLTLKLAELLGCSIYNETEMVDCLKNIHPTKIVEQQFFVETVHPLALTRIIPVVDYDFISDTPTNIIRHSLKKIEILIGGTKDDGNPFTIFGAPGFNRNHESLITTEELVEGIIRFFPTAGELGTESILFEYKDWEDEDSKMKNREAMELILRDYYMICPMKHFANEISKHTPNIYFYEFDHHSSREVWPEWMGVLHGAILPFMFGKALIEERNFTEAEQSLSRRVMRAWANFAREGTPYIEEDNFTWPPYSPEDEKYVVLKTGAWEIKSKLYAKRCRFWNSFLPKLVRQVGTSFDGNLWTNLKSEQACYTDGFSPNESCQKVLD